MTKIGRRNFLKKTSLSAASLYMASNVACATEKENQASGGSYMGDFAAPKLDIIRIALIGVGARGSGHAKQLASIEGTEIVAIADVYEDLVDHSVNNCIAVGKGRHQNIARYFGAEGEWRKMLVEVKPDAVFISTNWNNHAPMAIETMKQGAHAFVEVPIAVTLQEMWDIVDTSEQTQKHCMMMENCCFNGEELWVLNMINEGVFGDVNHAEGAYIHDLRKHMMDETYYEDQWRIKHHQTKNGNFYTGHGLGPVSFYMDIGRGDNYDHLVSMSSKEQSLSEAAVKNNFWATEFACGDMNTTLIKTKLGRSIMLQFDTHTGRPYSRLNTVTGTKAVHQGYPSRLYVGHNELQWGHSWLKDQEYREYRERYDHPLWKRLREQIDANAVGHGGMDFVMIYRLIRCLNQGLPLDINLYDSVLWSAITPLSQISVANNSASTKVPDFTGGSWVNKRKNEVLRPII